MCDAQIRRESTDIEDMFIGHVNGMDCYARGLRAAAAMIKDGKLATGVKDRCAPPPSGRTCSLSLSRTCSLTFSRLLSPALSFALSPSLPFALASAPLRSPPRRYAGFDKTPIGKKIASGKATLAEMAAHAAKSAEPTQKSGKHEKFEAIFNGYAYGK